ncbi:MAG: hypothetical protein RJB01_1102, partial [Actinomycetota bacterium]
VGALQAMSAAFPVAQDRDQAALLAALVEFSVNHALPRAWDSPRLREALAQLPWNESIDQAQLLWELHHDGSQHADVSVSVRSRTGRDSAVLVDFEIDEFDISEAGAEKMGTFYRVQMAPMGADLTAWTQRVFDAAGVRLEVADNPALEALTAVAGQIDFVGVTPRRAGVRVIFGLETVEQLAAVGGVLAAAGVPEATVARLPLLEPLIASAHALRLAVDATEDSIEPNIGVEVFLRDGNGRWLPGVLDALGLDSGVIEELTSVLDRDPVVRELMLAPGVVTDQLRYSPMHVKIAFDANGNVSAKTYVAVDNLALTTFGRTVEDRDVPATWEFHDLLFHSQVRNGRLRHRIGGTARFSVVPELNLQPGPVPPGDVVLPAVDVAAVVAADPPFGEVMRNRESDRDWNGPEISLESLAELLARVGEIIPREMEFGDQTSEFGGAPYPSGGGIYETDIVVLAHRVTGLEPGAYLYRRESRSLKPLMGSDMDRDSLLIFAAEATGNGVSRPQALLVLAARFPDLAVKYEGIAYALMVKHVGVLMATIAYTASAMGLGAVPIGTGDSDAFAAATGLDYYRHGSIGEIAISQPPTR